MESQTVYRVLIELGERLRKYRISVGWTQEDLCNQCGISVSTLVRMEKGEDTKLSNLIRVINVLDLNGRLDMIIPDVQPNFKEIYNQKPPRQRATGKRKKNQSEWVWGEDIK